jgi:hypothetical protein
MGVGVIALVGDTAVAAVAAIAIVDVPGVAVASLELCVVDGTSVASLSGGRSTKVEFDSVGMGMNEQW